MTLLRPSYQSWKSSGRAVLPRVRHITDRVYPRGGQAHYATVQKLLERLESKHFVSRDRSHAAHTFMAMVDRDGLIGRRLQSLAQQLRGVR